MSFMTKSQAFTTQVGQRIERATNEGLASEDWALNMEICDIINETDEGPKDAMKAIKKKLIGNKKWKEVMYTLTVLETCVKNCDHRMHVLACKQDFVRELVKIIQPNVNPPTVIQEKILAMIQTWADAFKRQSDLHGVVKVYEELKQKGIEFPATDLDSFSPVITPIRSTPDIDPAMNRPPPSYNQSQTPASPPPPVQSGPPQPPPNQGGTQQHIAKLKRDLDMVNTNVKVMSEMLTELVPGQESPDDYQLLTELNQTCRSMQQRVMELLGQVTHEEIMGELLRINDDLNNLFVRYDRHERYRQTQASTAPPVPSSQPAFSPMPQPVMPQPGIPPQPVVPPPQNPVVATQQPTVMAAQPPPPAAAPPAVPPLIDFGDVSAPAQPQPGLTQQLAGLDINSSNAGGQLSQVPSASGDQPALNDDFDMFAQSRQTSYQTRGGSTYQDNTNMDQNSTLADLVQTRMAPEQPKVTGQGLDGVEAWLTASDLSKPADTLAAANTNQTSQDGGISSTEFDKFLQERAKAAESLPERAPAPNNRSGRQLQMEEAENTMFAL